ncbi:MAG: alpha-amylase [Candidatus Kapabacteria bacterium]|nr:alpha-amylase [Candidatus Kapabacteria bacterium]
MSTPSIVSILRHQLTLLAQRSWSSYAVPGIWLGTSGRQVFSSPPAYHLLQLQEIERLAEQRGYDARQQCAGLTYNALVRHAVAYDHGPSADAEGWSTQGTILKMCSLLPYLSRLGVDTIVLLPICDRGVIGRKGNLGSPYAVRHPFRLDHELVEPALAMSADDVFRAFVAAAHMLGIRVVVEMVLRTASIDSDLAHAHREWFYWVDEDVVRTGSFTAPKLSAAALATAKRLVAAGTTDDLPAPPASYRKKFAGVPRVIAKDDHGWLGIGAQGERLRIPGAFADWPPDDPQPAWQDVTYLRMHDHPDFGYMAYDTIRYYNGVLDQPAYRMHGLWNLTAGVIPHFKRLFDIDGAMIDMGHALPKMLQRRVVSEARTIDPDFIFLEENFRLDAASVQAGYDGVVGYVPMTAHIVDELRKLVRRIADGDVPIRYFASPETHNTPRAASRRGGVQYALASWGFLRCLPKGMPFLHAGMELGEQAPVNTGLGFSKAEQQRWTEDKLPLFSSAQLPWDDAETVVASFQRLEHAITTAHWFRLFRDDDIIIPLDVDHPSLVAFIRYGPSSSVGVIVAINMSDEAATCVAKLPSSLRNIVTAANREVQSRPGGALRLSLQPWQCVHTAFYIPPSP